MDEELLELIDGAMSDFQDRHRLLGEDDFETLRKLAEDAFQLGRESVC